MDSMPDKTTAMLLAEGTAPESAITSLEAENLVILERESDGVKFVISPSPYQIPIGSKGGRLKAVPRLNVRPGRLRENVVVVPGSDGAQRTVLGYEDAEVELTLQIWEEKQLSNLKILADFFRPKRESKEHEPLKVRAPGTQRWGIEYLYITEIREHPWDPRTGLIVEINMREWQPKERKKTKGPQAVSPKGASSPGGMGTGSSDFSFLDGRDIAAPSQKGPPKP